jgi:hypothetical protein
MRERDMRLRVERFLQTRLRSMLMPATLGLGLALGGCNSDALSTDDGGNQTQKKDTGSVQVKYMAQIPEAGPELPAAQPDYMAQLPDSGMAVRYMAQQPDAGGAVAVYSAQVPPENT